MTGTQERGLQRPVQPKREDPSPECNGLVGVLVSNDGDYRRRIGTLFEAHGWRLHCANDLRETRSLLQNRAIPIAVVDGDAASPSWREVMSDLSHLPCRNTPRLIVTSCHVDDALWAEVLNLGAYDLLVEPLREKQAGWVIAQALSDWRRQAH
jgi:DNA-binding NtrC family response regulator